MSKPWKPGRTTVALAPSRIRREPVRIAPQVKPRPRNRERELWLGIGGVVAMAAACAALVIGISDISSKLGVEPAEAAASGQRFSHCYSASSADCVLDGNSIQVDGRQVELAIDAPRIANARCEQERQRGIESAIRLRALLNGGDVTVSDEVRGAGGRVTSNVQVDGLDVAGAMVASGAAREEGIGRQGWC